MSDWESRVSGHPVHERLSELEKLLVELREESDSTLFEDLARLQAVHGFVSHRLDAVDPALAPAATLNNLNTNVEKITVALTQYQTGGEDSAWQSAQAVADTVIIQALNLPLPLSADEVEGLGAAVARVRRGAGQHLANVRKDAEALEVNIETLEQKLTETKQEVSQQKARLDKAITDFQGRTAATEAEQQKAFTEDRASRKTSFEEFTDEMKMHWTADVLPWLEKQKEDVERIVFAIANTGMAGGYQRHADMARKERLVWQVTAVISMGAFVGLATWAAWAPITGREFDWHIFGARAFVAAAFAVLATYAGKQGDRHARRERFNRQLELELASLQPYLAQLDDEEKKELTKTMAERFFGLYAHIDEKEEGPLPAGGGLLELAKVLWLDRIGKPR